MTALADRLGIFAKTFAAGTPAKVAAAVRDAGYTMGHWNFAAVGRDTLGTNIDRSDAIAIREAFDASGIGIPSVSATFNVADPEADRLAERTAAAVRLIGISPVLGDDLVVTLCSGTLDPDDMWRAHPGNDSPAAWTALRRTLDPLLGAAAHAGVRLGIEPEPGNIVADAPTAKRLLDELGEGAPIGIILDCANLLTPETLPRQAEILAEAVDLIGPRVIAAQAKDVVASGKAAPGRGGMDYGLVMRTLRQVPEVPLVVQDTDADDARRVRDFLLEQDARA